MTRAYDNWERLVEATLRREHFRLSSLRSFSDLSLPPSSSSSFRVSPFPSRLPSFNFSGLLMGNSFTYHQILQATDLLSQSNLIKHGHSGDLFYGVLEGGIQVVVQEINLSSVQIESYYIISELEILNKVSHARVVPLLGHCLENMNEKYLVYKYMPNKDLSSYLRRKTVSDDDDCRQLQPLDWKTTLKIAIGAAEGLCYLHHDCVPPIVHRDIQASSILLDDNFEVRLGSLSEVCPAIEIDGSKNRIARFFRLPKVAGQDTSGTSNWTCADDVYCFGKVLLQLVTGRLRLDGATDLPDLIPPSPSGRRANYWKDLTIWIYDKELIRKILDPSLIVKEDVFMEVWAVAILAKACLNPKPSKRPPMSQVLKALRNGRITESSLYEMTRTVQSYNAFLGPISPRLYS